MSSTMTPQQAVGHVGGATGARLFRGRSLEELLPQIREELGEDAIVLRQREGLAGGVGGFFQQRFVEVEAVAGARQSFDAYDDEPAFPEPLAAPTRTPLPAGRPELRADDAPTGDAIPAAPTAAPAAGDAPPAGKPAKPGKPGRRARRAAKAQAAVAASGAEAPAAAAAPAVDEDPSVGRSPSVAEATAGETAELDGPAFLRHLDAALRRRREEEAAEAAAGEGEAAAAPAEATAVAAGLEPVAADPAAVAPAFSPIDAEPKADELLVPAAPSAAEPVAPAAPHTAVEPLLPAVAPDPAASAPAAAAPRFAASTIRASRTAPSVRPADDEQPAAGTVAGPTSRPASTDAPAQPTIVPWTPQRAAVRDEVAGVEAAPEHLQVTVPAAPAPAAETATPAPAVSTTPTAAAAPSPAAAPPAAAVPAAPSPAATPRRTAPTAPIARPAGTATPPAAPASPTVDVDVAEYQLVSRGLAPEIARPVVREAAVAEGALDAATRARIAQRLPAVADRDDVRTLAVVGAPGAGRTSAVGALCRAYAADGRSVLVVALRPTDDGAALRAAVAGTDVAVVVAATGEEIADARAASDADVCLIDTPVVRRGRAKLVATVAADLRAAGTDEVHLAVPGTDAAVGVTATIDAFAELGADALLMTHRDLADRPGGVLSGAILRRLPVSYVTDGHGIALADPAGLARMVQP